MEVEETGCDSSDDSASLNSSEYSEEDEEENLEEKKIEEINTQLQANPYMYDLHIQRIASLRKIGDLIRLRSAREEMHILYPLSPDLWLDWLADEQNIALTDEQKQSVIVLFGRAVKDYASVSIWLRYVKYVMSNLEKPEEIRNTFEQALTAVGLHVTEGMLIWEQIQEFENAYLSRLQGEEEKRKQKQRISKLFLRQLSVPLKGMEETYHEFCGAFPKGEMDAAFLYKQALKQLESRMPFEDALSDSDAPHLEEYKKYIEFEIKENLPVRVQNLYERALVENCLVPELWLEYTEFLEKTIQIKPVVLLAYERAVRNCPWSVQCWIKRAMAMEYNQEPASEIKDVYEKALNVGYTQGEEYLELWLSYADFMRRRTADIQDEDRIPEANEELVEVFSRAAEHMLTSFPNEDFHCTIRQYWAKVEAKYCKNLLRAREIWDEIVNEYHKKEAQTWLKYAEFERMFGDTKHCQSVFKRGIRSATDWPESVAQELVTFERQEGTLQGLKVAVQKYERAVREANERQERMVVREKKEEQKKQQRLEKHKRSAKSHPDSPSAKKPRMSVKANPDKHTDADGFKIPFPAQEVSKVAKSPSEQKKVKDTAEASQEVKHGEKVEHDSSKDNRSIFVSNLAYVVGEEEIRKMLSQVGEIEEVRLVRDFKGRSKGYCYVVFKTGAAARNALDKDRERLNGRPVYISRCEDKKRSSDSGATFKFSTGLEVNKLFVRNLPFSMKEEELVSMFSEFGALKEVRLVTHKSGASKGLAYVEYKDEASATTALVKSNGMKIGTFVISVAKSNPPQHKEKKDRNDEFGGTSFAPDRRQLNTRKPRSTPKVMLPRSVQKSSVPSSSSTSAAASTSNHSENGNGVTGERLGNEDFRRMFLKK